MRLKSFCGALLAGALTACAGSGLFRPLPSPNSDNIRLHMEFLAADELAGRSADSAGYRRAANYVAAQFAAPGLQPAGDQGYLQQVPLRRASWGERKPNFVLHGHDGDIIFDFGEDFLAAPPVTSEDTAVRAELVFVGYGIEAPEYGFDDYSDLDLSGRIAVVLSGRPQRMPSEVGAHYASGRVKRETAARHGAVGVITLNTPQRERRLPFKKSLKHLRDDAFDWVDAEGVPGNAVPGLHPGVTLDMPAARQLFVGAERSLDTVFTEMENNIIPHGFALPYSASLASASVHEEIFSPNVVAVLPGSDPRLRHEYVIISAHLDHIGVGWGEGDQINNGAQDNAAGVAVMLETARLFAESGHAPRRSLLFVAVTGEEKGLLGSDYFTRHLPVPTQSVVANINLDMPMLLYPFRDVIAFGATHSTLGKSAERAAGRTSLKLSPDPMPEKAIFVRSDHYNFVRQGIPAIYLISGREAWDPDTNGAAIQQQFFRERYHKPADEADEQIDYAAARQFTRVIYAIAREVADADQRPSWYPGDFFGELFARH